MATVNITVNDSTKIGTSLVEIARNLSKHYKSVVVNDELPEDEWLANEMQESRKTGKGDKKKLMESIKN